MGYEKEISYLSIVVMSLKYFLFLICEFGIYTLLLVSFVYFLLKCKHSRDKVMR